MNSQYLSFDNSRIEVRSRVELVILCLLTAMRVGGEMETGSHLAMISIK
jgi:hypothetical protein